MTTAESFKRFTTLQARAALAGITFHRIEGDFGHPVYVATRGAMTCHFDDLDDVEDWLNGVAGTMAAVGDGAFTAIQRPAPVGARVRELRLAGYEITTSFVSLVDRDGYSHPRAALYSLEHASSQEEMGCGG